VLKNISLFTEKQRYRSLDLRILFSLIDTIFRFKNGTVFGMRNKLLNLFLNYKPKKKKFK
jgi:hypothetical protein